MKKCLDEGIIQAYTDGELEPAAAQAAAAHLAQCEACAASLAEVETETAFLSASFAPDAAWSVPTELLRARVGAAVARLEEAPAATARRRGWDFGALLAPFIGLFSFTPQRAAAFGGLLAVVALGVLFFAVRERTTPVHEGGEVVRVESGQPAARRDEVATPAVNPDEAETNPPVQVSTPAPVNSARAERSHAKRRAAANRQPALPTETAAAPKAEVKPEALVPGEENYREAIASLEQVVKAGGDAVLAPKARIEYERNIAVLDRAIEETRNVALRNPKNRDAVGFLMAAYQSKVELLSTVADQTQVAAIGR